MDTTEYDELNALLGQIESGMESEKNAALHELYERVRNSNDGRARNLLGIGFLRSGRYDDAVQVFTSLVETDPVSDAYRINLAAAYTYTQQFELARYHYQHLVDHAATQEGRDYGRNGLASIQQALQEGDEKTFLDLQVAALRERRSQGEAGPQHYRRLAFIYLQREQSAEPLDSLEEITTLLNEGTARYPQSIDILELLALCYSRTGDNERLEETVRRIEKIDPDHRVLRVLQGIDEQSLQGYEDEMLNRAYALLDQSQSKDPALRQAALAELGKMVTMYPTNPSYRGLYGFALSGVGQKAEAIRQAEILAETAGEEHGTQFNLGQIFWMSGDPERGRKHLELAYRYAANDEERQDTRDRIADLESRPNR